MEKPKLVYFASVVFPSSVLAGEDSSAFFPLIIGPIFDFQSAVTTKITKTINITTAVKTMMIVACVCAYVLAKCANVGYAAGALVVTT